MPNLGCSITCPYFPINKILRFPKNTQNSVWYKINKSLEFITFNRYI